MKKVWSKGIVMVIAALFVSVFSINTSKAQGSISLQVFYDELQPYGTWMQHGTYGYVWMPQVDRGFTPYATNGYWINTEYGNTWVSDYSWGWAPFHYGRWFHDDFYGWMWVPDTEWAPAWVAWRSGGGYYGWAPLMPGFGINVSFSYYDRLPSYYWNFVPYRYITYRTVYRHCVPRPHVVNIIHHTTIVTHNYTDSRRRTYFTGPSRRDMERTGRTRVEVYKVADRNRPGRTEIERGTANFYKPEVDGSRGTRSGAMPTRYVRPDENGRSEIVESRRERTTENPDRGPANNTPRERIGRTETAEREIRNNANEISGREREMIDRNPQHDGSQRREQIERQRNPATTERWQQNSRQPSNEIRRNPAQQSQRMQQMERQAPGRSQQPSRDFQPQRSGQTPGVKGNSMQQQRPQQIQRSAPQQRNSQPARTGGRENSSRRRVD